MAPGQPLRTTTQRWTRTFFFMLGALWIGIGLWFIALLQQGFAAPLIYRKDFLQDYLVGRAIARGFSPYAELGALARYFVPESPIATFPHPSPHPPPIGFLFVPLASFDYASAARLWLGIESVCFLTAVYLLLREFVPRGSLLASLALSVALVAWPPVFTDLALGQIMVPMLLLLVAFRRSLLSDHDRAAGIFLGLAVLIKPVAWPVFILLALRHRWRALIAAGGVLVVGYAVSTAVFGFETMQTYFLLVLPAITKGYEGYSPNQSLWTLGYRLFAGTGWAHFYAADVLGVIAAPLISAAWLAPIISAALPALLALGAAWTTRHRSVDHTLGAFLCLSVLVSPIAWVHYLVLIIIPFAQVLAWLATTGLPRWPTRAFLLLGALTLMPYALWEQGAFVLGGKVYTPDLTASISFGPGLLTLMPALTVLVLLVFVARIGAVERETVTSPERAGHPSGSAAM
jgi:hypothetical protein